MAFKDKSDSSSRNISGIIIKHPSYTGTVTKPSYGKEFREYTLFRPTGPLNKEGTDFMPWRNSGAEGDFGIGGTMDWVYKEDVFSGGTVARVTFLAATVNDNGEAVDNEMSSSIVHDFVRLVKRQVKGTVDELKLFQGGQGRSPALAFPKTHGFIQGMLVARGAENYADSPKFPCIMMLSTSAKDALIQALEAPNPEFTGDADDLENRFMSGDLLSATKGKVLCFYADKPEAVTVGSTGIKPTLNVNMGNTSRGPVNNKADKFNRYICDIRDQGFADFPRDASGRIAIPSDKLFTPWNRALRYLTENEMIEQLIKAFNDVPHILKMGLGHIPGALPASITKGQVIVNGTAEHKPVVSNTLTAATKNSGHAGMKMPSFVPTENGVDDLDEQPSTPTKQTIAETLTPGVKPDVEAAIRMLNNAINK